MAKTNVKVDLTDTDGNVFSIISKVSWKLQLAGEVAAYKEFDREACSDDLDVLIATCRRYVELTGDYQ